MLRTLSSHLTMLMVVVFFSTCYGGVYAGALQNETPTQVVAKNNGLLDVSNCMIEKTFKVHFSSGDKMDDLRIVVQGEPCIQGDYVISIYSNDDLLFNHKGKVSDLYVDSVGKTINVLFNDLDSLVKEERSGAWPEYVKEVSRDESLEEFGEVYRFFISKNQFESYRKDNVPSLAIATSYDEVIHLVYEPHKKVSEIAWSSGL